jgi:hypothetical protein
MKEEDVRTLTRYRLEQAQTALDDAQFLRREILHLATCVADTTAIQHRPRRLHPETACDRR